LVLLLGGGGVITNVFDLTGVTGNYTFNGNAGGIVNYVWMQEPYRGRLWPIEYTGLVPMTIRLDFTSLTNGTLSGTAYPVGPSFGISGSFFLQ
jgi:hypothetical protein